MHAGSRQCSRAGACQPGWAGPVEGAPGKRRQQVTPAMTAEMRWLRSLKEGLVSCSPPHTPSAALSTS